MSISKEFYELFDSFIKQYQTQGKGGYLTWGKDKQYDVIINTLIGLKDVIHINHEVFNDHSIINYLSVSSLMLFATSPVFAANVSQLLCLYDQRKPGLLSSILSKGLHIKIEPEEADSINLIEELHQAIENTKKAHENEIKALKFENGELRKKDQILEEQNCHFKQMESQYLEAQSQTKKFQIAREMLLKLNEIIGITSPSETATKQPVLGSPTRITTLEPQDKPNYPIPPLPPSATTKPTTIKQPSSQAPLPPRVSKAGKPEDAKVKNSSNQTVTKHPMITSLFMEELRQKSEEFALKRIEAEKKEEVEKLKPQQESPPPDDKQEDGKKKSPEESISMILQ